MSSNLVEQLNALSDSDAVAFLQYFNQGLLDGIVDDFGELIDAIPQTIKSMPEFSEIDRLSLDEESQLEGEEAVAISRKILENLANNPRFAPLLQKALEAYNNLENMQMGGGRAKDILAVGLAASMILVASSAKYIHIDAWGITFLQEEANPELVQHIGTLIEPLVNLVGN
ncbi:hypothetical protein ACL6C3_14750 [Capilliphycus salinus ALCB114379]|uniref:hypothetical protein n=1 Tax=Capilliphycus salinus TaxID=2768948 RepID=UPI0039A6CDB5